MANVTTGIKRNDNVQVIAGKDKGKTGRVLRVFPDKGRILVEHVGMVKNHVKPDPRKNTKGGIAEQESAIAISNVALVCGSCGPTRIAHKGEGKQKNRVCAKCGNDLGGK